MAIAAEETARTGRPCLLKRPGVVAAMLRAMVEGRSRSSAARAAGVSESVSRRWLQPGMQPARACAELQRVLLGVERGHALPVSVLGVELPPAMDAPVEAPRPVAAAVPPAPSKVPSVADVLRWHGLMRRASRCSECERDAYLVEVARELRAYGLADVPPMPDRWLPAGLDYHAVCSRYVQWCHETGRPGPTEYDVECNAGRWYRERMILPSNTA